MSKRGTVGDMCPVVCIALAEMIVRPFRAAFTLQSIQGLEPQMMIIPTIAVVLKLLCLDPRWDSGSSVILDHFMYGLD